MTTKRIGRKVLLGALLTLAALGVTSPATADGGMTLVYEPPPFTMIGDDLAINALVESECGVVFCGPIHFRVNFVVDPDEIGSDEVELRSLPAQLARGEIPGWAVQPPVVSYWLEASQTRCLFVCHTEAVRAPARGTYDVPVSFLLG